jgi:DNA segregation ATPase FtsK/SpoIIIE-like protein
MPDEPGPMDAVEEFEDGGLSPLAARLAVRRREERQIAKYGFFVHYVFDESDMPWGVDIHSHGVLESFGHADFQIVAGLPPDLATEILTNLVDEVKEGRKFAAGTTASGIIRRFDVGFAVAAGEGRELLRVIVPDTEGRLARGEIDEAFGRQYEGTM